MLSLVLRLGDLGGWFCFKQIAAFRHTLNSIFFTLDCCCVSDIIFDTFRMVNSNFATRLLNCFGLYLNLECDYTDMKYSVWNSPGYLSHAFTFDLTLRDRKMVKVQTGVCQQTTMQWHIVGSSNKKKKSALTSGSSATWYHALLNVRYSNLCTVKANTAGLCHVTKGKQRKRGFFM